MAAITASMVAELRARTDAPMMECKKALTEADGDMTRAEEILRVKLGNKAGKAAARITAEGKLYTCLFAVKGHDFRDLIRGGAGEAVASEWPRSRPDFWRSRAAINSGRSGSARPSGLASSTAT